MSEPRSGPGQLLALQRRVGNRAVSALVLQAKLSVGAAEDPHEREADRIASLVMRSIDGDAATDIPAGAPVDAAALSLKPAPTSSEPTSTVGVDGGEVDEATESTIRSSLGGGAGLEPGLRAKMETGFGADFSDVRVHTGGRSDTLNRSLNATAFTTGNDIFFRAGAYDPGSRGGQELVAHELTHVVQQGRTDAVQRFTDAASWKKASARPRSLRSKALKVIDKAVARFGVQQGRPEHEFGFEALRGLIEAIAGWRAEKAGQKNPSARQSSVDALEAETKREMTDVIEMKGIRDRLKAAYGITLDNQAGEDAIKRSYGAGGPYGGAAPAAKKVLDQLEQRGWALDELRQIERALAVYAPLLGAKRDKALGDQPITSFSRLDADITGDKLAIEGKAALGSEQVTDIETFAETFTKTAPQLPGVTGGPSALSNISMFSNAQSVLDFAGDPHNPTPDELQKGYRGTVIHELSHGLIEPLPAPAGAPPWGDGRAVKNMEDHFTNVMDFWDDQGDESGVANAEGPITGYGQTNPAEDLAETIMFFFESPSDLRTKCPSRFAFVETELSRYLDAKMVEDARVAAGAIPAAPGLPAVPAAARGVGGGGGGVTPQALKGAKDGLKQAPPGQAKQLDPVPPTAAELVLALAKLKPFKKEAKPLATDGDLESGAVPGDTAPADGTPAAEVVPALAVSQKAGSSE